MGRKKKKRATPLIFCYYCDRDFDNEKVLVQHQRAKHFKCPHCNKRLGKAQGMSIHVYQVHKDTINKVPAAIKGRDSFDVEISGMVGVPLEVIEKKRAEKLGEPNAKRPNIGQNVVQNDMMPPQPQWGRVPPPQFNGGRPNMIPGQFSGAAGRMPMNQQGAPFTSRPMRFNMQQNGRGIPHPQQPGRHMGMPPGRPLRSPFQGRGVPQIPRGPPGRGHPGGPPHMMPQQSSNAPQQQRSIQPPPALVSRGGMQPVGGAPDPSRTYRPSSSSSSQKKTKKKQVRIYDNENDSVEELRARLPRYKVKPPQSREEMERLSSSIHERLSRLG